MQYRKKSVVIQAVQHTGGNHPACGFMDDNGGNGAYYWKGCELYIRALEGDHHVSEGDFIIKGVNGKFYPCKPDIFEKTYVAVESENCDCGEAPQTTNLDFGQAVRYMKEGRLIRRAGWNGKGIHVYLEDHFSFVVPAGVFKGNKRTYLPVMVMFNAKGEHQPGWNASTADVLANDWQVVE